MPVCTSFVATTTSTSPTESATPTDEPEEPEPDWESDDCKECGNELGSSECPADDERCLLRQCEWLSVCTRCTSDCAGDYKLDPKKGSEPGDFDTDYCKECGSNMGASECSADDDQCLIDECKADYDCASCGADCENNFF